MHRFKSCSAFPTLKRFYSAKENSGSCIKQVSMTSSSPAQAKRDGLTILVVDDEIPILRCVRRILEISNYTVITSPSGDHAWATMERGQVKVDLVLTDVVMPGSIDGLTLAAKIRQREPTLPVLFLTGALLEDAEFAAEIAAKKLLLRKPFSPEQLVEFVDWHFAQSGLSVGATRP